MADRMRAPLPEEITDRGYVVLPPAPVDTPLGREYRLRERCRHGHPFLPQTTVVTITPEGYRRRRCLVCLGRYRAPLPGGAA